MSFLPAEKQLEILMRGVIDQVPQGALLEKLRRSKESGVPLRIKMGVDPTAPDVHLGHTVVMRKLRQFQDLGHQVVLIIGDYTAMVGDPSGRSTTRAPLTHEEVLHNAETYQKQFFQIVDEKKTEIHYNGDWFSKLPFSQVLHLLSQMTVAQMLERQDFSARYKNGSSIGIHEFVYPLMQGWDSVMIRADVELGGTDQKFNVLRGRELQSMEGQEGQVGLFLPILLGTDGQQKMSKSLNNYVGLNESALSMYHKIINISDSQIANWFELLTDLPIQEIKEMEKGITAGTVSPQEQKHLLATAIVSGYHGEEAARLARETEAAVHSGEAIPEDAPQISLSEGDYSALDLVIAIGAFSSKGEARRMFANGGVKIDRQRVEDPQQEVSVKKELLVQVGKRKFYKINY